MNYLLLLFWGRWVEIVETEGDTGVQCGGGLGWRVGVAQSGQRDKSGPGRAGKVGRGDGQQTRLRVVCQGIALVAHLQRGGHRRRLRAHSVHLQQCKQKEKNKKDRKRENTGGGEEIVKGK